MTSGDVKMTFYVTPYGRLAHRRMIERMLQDGGWNMPVESEIAFPVDIKAEPEAFIITALLPGIKPEDLDIQVVNETVTIQGKLLYQQDEKANYLVQERPYGNFSRVLTLPASLDPNGAEAHFENGVLTLRVPKAETARPKTIKVISN
jgi:HSP20 family protein